MARAGRTGLTAGARAAQAGAHAAAAPPAPRALCFTASGSLGDALSEHLQREGFMAAVVNVTQVSEGVVRSLPCDLAVFDANLPGVSPELLARLRSATPALITAAVVGWWDAREEDLRPQVDFVLNAPLRDWQTRELAAGLLAAEAGRRSEVA